MQPVRHPTKQSIDEVLEECRVRLGRGETVEECLAAYPAHADELARLLPLAHRLQHLARDPDPTYVAAARRRFQLTLAAARENRARAEAARSGPLGWLRRLAAPLAAVLILCFGGFGLVQVSADSLPDSPLYTVKRASEDVGEVLVRTPQDSVSFNMLLANRRRMELERAIGARKGPMVLLTLAGAMVDASNRATEAALANEGSDRPELMARLRQLLAAERAALNPIANSPRIALANAARGYQQELLADEQKLVGK